MLGNVSRTSTQLIIVLELAEKGSLLTMLRKHGDISKLQRVRWAIDVSTGMEYLTRLGFIHRDIAARNVLVMADGSCKISDFGFSKETCDNKDYVHVPGRIAFQWAAIEALQDSKYTAKSDVWSFGVLLFELWSKGQKPYGSWDNLRVRSELHDGYRLPPPQRCPLEIYTIMMDCWHPDEHQRPDFYTLTVRQLTVLSRALAVTPFFRFGDRWLTLPCWAPFLSVHRKLSRHCPPRPSRQITTTGKSKTSTAGSWLCAEETSPSAATPPTVARLLLAWVAFSRIGSAALARSPPQRHSRGTPRC